MQQIRQRAADSTRDPLFYMSWVHAMVPTEVEYVIVERWLYGGRREIILGPPGSGKSTCMSSLIEWQLGWDPNFRWLIVSEIMSGRAKEHVVQIGNTIRDNEKYRLCFGELGGRFGKDEWSSFNIRLRTLEPDSPPPPFPWLGPRGRRKDVAWPNVKAEGWRSVKPGSRCDAILLDDYVSQRVSNSKVQTEQARKVLSTVITTRLSSHPRERIFYLGQRWMPRDLPALIMEGPAGSGSNAFTVYDNNPRREGMQVLDRAA